MYIVCIWRCWHQLNSVWFYAERCGWKLRFRPTIAYLWCIGIVHDGDWNVILLLVANSDAGIIYHYLSQLMFRACTTTLHSWPGGCQLSSLPLALLLPAMLQLAFVTVHVQLNYPGLCYSACTVELPWPLLQLCLHFCWPYYCCGRQLSSLLLALLLPAMLQLSLLMPALSSLQLAHFASLV